jgi:hypothetical protein
MHPALPITLIDAERLPVRLLLQAEVWADAHDRVERRTALRRAHDAALKRALGGRRG